MSTADSLLLFRHQTDAMRRDSLADISILHRRSSSSSNANRSRQLADKYDRVLCADEQAVNSGSSPEFGAVRPSVTVSLSTRQQVYHARCIVIESHFHQNECSFGRPTADPVGGGGRPAGQSALVMGKIFIVVALSITSKNGKRGPARPGTARHGGARGTVA